MTIFVNMKDQNSIIFQNASGKVYSFNVNRKSGKIIEEKYIGKRDLWYHPGGYYMIVKEAPDFLKSKLNKLK